MIFVLSFTIFLGHLLFEMMCGYELTTLSPSNSDWQNVKDDAQLEVRGHTLHICHPVSLRGPHIILFFLPIILFPILCMF